MKTGDSATVIWPKGNTSQTMVVDAKDDLVFTTHGTFRKSGNKWRWIVDGAVQMELEEKEAAATAAPLP